MPDQELDLDKMDFTDPAAVQHLRDAYQRQADARQKSEADLAVLQAAQRSTEVKSILTEMKVPAQIADLYPHDGAVTKDSVKAFVKDKIGIDPDLNDAWKLYDQRQGGEPPEAPEDELAILARKATEDTAKFYARQYAPTDAETKELEDLKYKVFNQLLPKWDQDVKAGRMGPLVDPNGFGGFVDPPPWAVRARYHVQSTQ